MVVFFFFLNRRKTIRGVKKGENKGREKGKEERRRRKKRGRKENEEDARSVGMKNRDRGQRRRGSRNKCEQIIKRRGRRNEEEVNMGSLTLEGRREASLL